MKSLACPKLPHERSDRCLAVGAGDGDRGLGLRTEEARGDLGEPPPRIGIGDERNIPVGLRSFRREDVPRRRATPHRR